MGTFSQSACCHSVVFLKKTKQKMKAVAVLLLAGLALASASALPKSAKTSPLSSYRQTMKAKGIGCDICTLVVTEIDKLIVADQTMDQLMELVGFSQELGLLATLLLKLTCPKLLKDLSTINS